MESFASMSCKSFAEALASKEPVPGGGGASALVAAVAVAMGNMVGSLTEGKLAYAAVQEDIARLNAKAADLRRRLFELADEDARVFKPMAQAYRLPKETAEEKALRSKAIAASLDDCCAVPLEIMQACCEGIDICVEYAEKGSRLAISDAGCALVCLKGALQAASLNVFVNTRLMKDVCSAAQVNRRAEVMLSEYLPKADAAFNQVAASCSR